MWRRSVRKPVKKGLPVDQTKKAGMTIEAFMKYHK
jgi:hypothetical protein